MKLYEIILEQNADKKQTPSSLIKTAIKDFEKQYGLLNQEDSKILIKILGKKKDALRPAHTGTNIFEYLRNANFRINLRSFFSNHNDLLKVLVDNGLVEPGRNDDIEQITTKGKDFFYIIQMKFKQEYNF